MTKDALLLLLAKSSLTKTNKQTPRDLLKLSRDLLILIHSTHFLTRRTDTLQLVSA